MPLGVSQEELISRADNHAPGSFKPLPGEFLPRCLDALRAIVNATGALIVLSSSWRVDDAQLACVSACLEAAGLSLAGTTPSLPPRPSRRAAEIMAWISEVDRRLERAETHVDPYGNSCESKDGRCDFTASTLFPRVWPAGVRVGAFVALDDQDLCAAATRPPRDKAIVEQSESKVEAEDEAAARALEPHFCRTDAATGLTMNDALRAIQILRSREL